MNNIQLAKSTNESLQFEKEKKVLMVIMPTAPFHTLISGSVSFPSFTPFTLIFPLQSAQAVALVVYIVMTT